MCLARRPSKLDDRPWRDQVEACGLEEAADAIDAAVEATLEKGIYTGDIAVDKSKAVGTAAMGDAIVAAL